MTSSYICLRFHVINPYNAELYCCINHRDQIYFFQFEISINVLFSFSASFEHLCYGSAVIIIFFFQRGDRIVFVKIIGVHVYAFL